MAAVEQKGYVRSGRSAWRALFDLRSQCRCVLSDSPAVADSCPTKVGQSCQRKRFPDFCWRRNRPSVVEPISVQPPGRGNFHPESRFSMLWGPGRHQEPGRRQARSRNSLPALSAAAVVQVPQAEQCVLRKRETAAAGRSSDTERGSVPRVGRLPLFFSIQRFMPGCRLPDKDRRRMLLPPHDVARRCLLNILSSFPLLTTVRHRPDRSRPPQVGAAAHTCTETAARTEPARTSRLRGAHLSKLRTPFSATRPAFAPTC